MLCHALAVHRSLRIPKKHPPQGRQQKDLDDDHHREMAHETGSGHEHDKDLNKLRASLQNTCQSMTWSKKQGGVKQIDGQFRPIWQPSCQDGAQQQECKAMPLLLSSPCQPPLPLGEKAALQAARHSTPPSPALALSGLHYAPCRFPTT